MKIYIMTDIEGAALVHSFKQTRPKPPDEPPAKLKARELLTGEVNAAIDGILDTVKEAEIYVTDGHGTGGLFTDQLRPEASVVLGLRSGELIDETFDGYFFVGQHAMAGAENGVLAHTYSSKSYEYHKLNGKLVGEFACRAAMAGTVGIPTVFVSGDLAATREAEAVIPDIVSATVKWGYGWEACVSLSPAQARELIREKAREACERMGEMSPYVVNGPYELEVRKLPGVPMPEPEGFCERWKEKHITAEFVDERTYRLVGDRLLDFPL